MFYYLKFLLCLLVVSFETNAKPLEDSEDAPNLFNLNGLAENNAPGSTFIEGDIAIPLSGRTAYIRVPKWSNGIVPFEFDQAYTTQQKNIIASAMNEIMNYTKNCIRFVARNPTSTTWLRIFPGEGCWSYMGNPRRRGAQDLSLQVPGCIHRSVSLHELLHALGFSHEQSRPDRDNYIRINYQNIQPGRENNFNKYSQSQVNTFNEAYDYKSIMHYRINAFSSNGRPTIEPIGAFTQQFLLSIGNGNTMSNQDLRKLRAYYSCS